MKKKALKDPIFHPTDVIGLRCIIKANNNAIVFLSLGYLYLPLVMLEFTLAYISQRSIATTF